MSRHWNPNWSVRISLRWCLLVVRWNREDESMKVDIVFLAHGRTEYTIASIEALMRNTNWPLVNNVYVYSDGSVSDLLILQDFCCSAPCGNAFFTTKKLGGPVAVMNDFLESSKLYPACASLDGVFAKIDNDVIVPPDEVI